MSGFKPHNGTIKNARFDPYYKWVEGCIYGSRQFPEGVYIHTSRIVLIDGNEIETLNSKYTVEWKDGKPPRVGVDVDLLKNVAEQFVVQAENGEEIDSSYYLSAFRDALGVESL